ncbi:hypothetical protein [Aeromonas encheleia]
MKTLPKSCFIPFETTRNDNCNIIWINNAYCHENNINVDDFIKHLEEEYFYVTDDYTTKSRLNLNDKKIFYADCYGSRYQAANGGSARCGYDGKYQVKGIGRTPLCAENIDIHHSTGKLTVSDACLEAIWGEICNIYFPFGSVRTLAVISTGELLSTDYNIGLESTQECALTIREFFIRPAHLERNIFFRPSLGLESLIEYESTRVLDAQKKVLLSNGEDKSQAVIDGFQLKLAEVISFSRLACIPHGSITSSNICLNGKVIDFGTMTSVPGYKNYVIARGQRGTWDEDIEISRWLRHVTDGIIRNEFSIRHFSPEAFSTSIATKGAEVISKLFGVGDLIKAKNIYADIASYDKTIRIPFCGEWDDHLLNYLETLGKSYDVHLDHNNLTLRKEHLTQENIKNFLFDALNKRRKNSNIQYEMDFFIGQI